MATRKIPVRIVVRGYAEIPANDKHGLPKGIQEAKLDFWRGLQVFVKSPGSYVTVESLDVQEPNHREIEEES